MDIFIWGDEFIEPVEKFLAQSRCSVNIWWMNEWKQFSRNFIQNTVSFIVTSLVALFAFLRGFHSGSACEQQRRPAVHHCAAASALPFPPLQLPTWGQHPWVTAFCGICVWTNRFKYPMELYHLWSWTISRVNLWFISLSWCDTFAPIFRTIVSFPLFFSLGFYNLFVGKFFPSPTYFLL